MYRLCEICGNEIAPERLEILPDTQRCVDCAREKGSDIIMRREIDLGFDAETYKDLLEAMRE